MRWHTRLMIACVVGIVSFGLAVGQQPLPPGGLGGLGGLMGKDSRPDPLTLLRNAGVKKELRLTPMQADKVDAAVWEALGKVLDDEQLKRLKEIDLQQRDYKAFGDTAVQNSLKLSTEQKDSIKIILADADKELKSLADSMKAAFGVAAGTPAGGVGTAKGGKAGKGGKTATQGLPNIKEKIDAISKDSMERCKDVLNNQQRRMWEEMVGDDFKLEMPKIDLGIKKG